MDKLNDRQHRLLNYISQGNTVECGRDYPTYRALARRRLVTLATQMGTGYYATITPKGYDTLVAIRKAEVLAAEVAAHHERMDAIDRVLTERKGAAASALLADVKLPEHTKPPVRSYREAAIALHHLQLIPLDLIAETHSSTALDALRQARAAVEDLLDQLS
jgi:hypothetical protein